MSIFAWNVPLVSAILFKRSLFSMTMEQKTHSSFSQSKSQDSVLPLAWPPWELSSLWSSFTSWHHCTMILSFKQGYVPYYVKDTNLTQASGIQKKQKFLLPFCYPYPWLSLSSANLYVEMLVLDSKLHEDKSACLPCLALGRSLYMCVCLYIQI